MAEQLEDSRSTAENGLTGEWTPAESGKDVEVQQQKPAGAPQGGKLERQTWGNDMQFLLSSIGYGVGFGNVWRFPYLVYRYGGGVFLIPFVFFLIFVALPMMLLESTVAQYAGIGPLHIYNTMCPAMKGCGVTAIYIAYVNSVQYIIILSYVVRYLATSFTRRLPWTECDPTFSHDGCYGKCRGEDPDLNYVIINHRCMPGSEFCSVAENRRVTCRGEDGQELVTQDPAFSFFYDRVLAVRHDDGSVATFTHYGYIVPSIFGCMFVSYVITGLTLEHGVATAGKVIYFTALFPYFGLIVLLVRAAMLPGFLNGLKFYLVPDFSQLWSLEVWYQALSQTFFSLGVGFGGLMTLSSYNSFTTPLYKMCLFNAGVNLFTSLLAGCVIFGSLGYIAHASGQSIDQVAGSGISLTFVTFPTTLAMLPAAPVWAIVFFLMMVNVGLDTQMGDLETQITAMLDHYPKARNYKSAVTFGLCFLGMVTATSMTFQGGFWLNALLNDYAATAPVLILALGNIFTFVYVYGYQTVLDHLEEMIGPLSKWNKLYMKITWRFLAPGFTIFLLGYFFTYFRGSMYDKPHERELYERWVQMIGTTLGVLPVVAIPIGMAHQFWKVRRENPNLKPMAAFKSMFQPEKGFISQAKREERATMGYLEMIQPTHQTEYVLGADIMSKRNTMRASPQRGHSSTEER